jgi:hypothetical protein
MGWTNSHLHQFRIGDVLYGMHFDDWPDEGQHEVEFKLADVAHRGDRFRYDYDFGEASHGRTVPSAPEADDALPLSR